MKRDFNSYIVSKIAQYGDKFDSSDLATQFIPYYRSQQRIEVDMGYEIKRGTIGITTGWKPCFLLMLRKDSIGSSYTLKNTDKIIKIIR